MIEIRKINVVVLICVLCVGCGDQQRKKITIQKPKAKELPTETVQELVSSEDLVLDLTPQLTGLANELKNNKSFELEHLEQSSVIAEFESFDATLKPVPNLSGVSNGSLEIQSAKSVRRNTDPWVSVNSKSKVWELAKFGVKSAKYKDSTHFEMKTVFSGRMRDSANSILGIKASQKLEFVKSGPTWKIVGWYQEHFKILRAKSSLFKNVTQSALPNENVRRSVIRSVHEEYLVNVVKTGVTPVYDKKYLPFADADMNHATPSVSVVDVNEDGWDDLFVTARWSPPVFLQNNKDGTFSDKTKEVGIIARGLVNCSLFVDIDNDDDKDLIMGRAMEPVVVMENVGGRFKDVTAKQTNLNRLFFVSAISACDINRDGLVDFYLSTYGAAGDNRGVDWKRMFLSKSDAQTLSEKERTDHMWVDFPGPPNRIVMNRGGGQLEWIESGPLVSQWHNSFQSVWGDFDLDGDDDLYVCNDFAPGGFLLNETPVGAKQPVFRDGISSAFPEGTMGFGMGASWSDYDCDGDLDLYVSNMYSKAGKRILAQLANNDPRFEVSASGNYLYRNSKGKFDQIAGPNSGQQPVHQVGWSYGGQFADFNNDGFSDLYVPSGFFTAPAIGETDVDL